MKPRNAFRALVFATVLLLGDKHAFAQQQTALVHGGTPYDPATVARIRGEIVAVEKFTRPDRGGVGLHLKVKTDKETIVVHLGPSWFLAERGLKLEPRDHVEVLGSRVAVGDEPEIIAAEIRKGEKIVKLRDGGGTPLWPGRARTRS
jgi:hypothetical protein